MKRRLVLIVLGCLVSPLSSLAQATEVSYSQRTEWFFAALRAGHIDEAVDGVYANNDWIKTTDQIARLKSGLRDWPATLGDFLGDERLTEEHLGARFVHLDYVVYFERRPVRVFFEFYRTKAGWVAQAVGLMDDISDWSKERARSAWLGSNTR